MKINSNIQRSRAPKRSGWRFLPACMMLAATFAFIPPFAATTVLASDSEASNRLLSLSARGEVKATPDMAIVNIGVVSQAAAASDALEDNEDSMRQIVKSLKARGIDKDDIRTSQFSVSPLYNNKRRREVSRAIIGYRVSNSVTVTVRELDALGSTLDRMIKLGSNRINNVHFAFSNLEELQDEARRKAVRVARRRAQLYASAAGVSLGPIARISDSQISAPRAFAAPMVQRTSGFNKAVTIAPGTQSISATIHMSWTLEDRD